MANIPKELWSLFINSRLSRCCTARGSRFWLSQVVPLRLRLVIYYTYWDTSSLITLSFYLRRTTPTTTTTTACQLHFNFTTHNIAVDSVELTLVKTWAQVSACLLKTLRESSKILKWKAGVKSFLRWRHFWWVLSKSPVPSQGSR